MQQRLKRQILLWGLGLILTLAGFSLSTPATYAQPLFLNSAPAGDRALEIFRTAYDNRYTWDSQFPGFTAAVEINQDGETYSGQIRINPDLTIEVSGIEDEDASGSVFNQLRMLVTHRRSVPFDVSHQQQTFSFGPTSTNGAVEIDQSGGTPSFYQVQDGKISQVNRRMGPVSVTVDLLDSHDTPLGYLGDRYRAFFKDAQTGELLSQLEFEDSYAKIGAYYIPTHQTIRTLSEGEQITTNINLTDIQLLS